jgi:hypothetical protein
LILQVLNPGHKAEAQQIAEPEELRGKPMGIRIVLLGSEDGVIVQQSIEHVERFASGARDGAGPIDAPLIGQMRIHRQSAVIIAKVAGAETPHQGVGVERKALTV